MANARSGPNATSAVFEPIPGPRRRASVANMVLAQARLELVLSLRSAESLLVTLVIPAALLAFFGGVAVLPIQDDDLAAFLVPGILALAVMSTSMVSLGISTAFERQYGVLKRLGGSPLPRVGLLAAKAAAVLVIEAVQVVLLLTIAWLVLGWRPTGGPAPLVLALVLGTLAFGGLGLWMAGALRAELTLALANGLYVLMVLLGGVIIPVSVLPPPLNAVASWLPSAALAEVLRGGSNAGSGMSLLDLANLTVWAFAAPLLAARTFRWE
jgi:ABC-2 type transport system permease protein